MSKSPFTRRPRLWDETKDRPGTTAILGPTNTGKTHLAIERMLGHDSGMIGFPLRLLARENYDRVVRLRGAGAAALITGEERIVPPNPRYFLCTVEAMPLDREVDFLAIDEIQLCADPERGHIFTDRLLHARGREETMFLGADTVRRLIARLVPQTNFKTRPRFSKLTHAGHKKVTRLPPRSAVIAFSSANVYELAELIRRQRGGAAVVLGALSPRTRNAQVALYEAGEVDYLVATDAIGMGLNMAIDHIAFSATAKFDGTSPRALTAAEIGQIAGRAGRHTADGSFGTTADQRPLDPDLVEAVEGHVFEPLARIYWRNRDLDFSSLDRLKQSLDMAPPRHELARARVADDYAALAGLMENPEITSLATDPDAVRLLWAVCQIPNFRNELTDGHQRLAARIYRFLMRGDGVIPTDWAARAIARLDRTDGDIDTLISRIAHIRTWTYISHRADWLNDAEHWQERARDLEDALSDALHTSLAQRFVDARTTTLVRRLDKGEALLAAVTENGDVIVEGAPIGRLEGFRLLPAEPRAKVRVQRDDGGAEHQILSAAKRALKSEIEARIRAVVQAPGKAFSLDGAGRIIWRDAPIARLIHGASLLRPTIEILPSDLVAPHQRDRLSRHLADWLREFLDRRLKALTTLAAADLSGAARGLAYQLVQGLGCADVSEARDQLAALTAQDRARLTALGVHFGVRTVTVGALMSRAAMEVRTMLWLAWSDHPLRAPDFAPSIPVTEGLTKDDYTSLGYAKAGPVAVRADLLERVLSKLRRRTRKGKTAIPEPETEAIAQTMAEFVAIMKACGLSAKIEDRQVLVTAAHGSGSRKDKKSAPLNAGTASQAKADIAPAKKTRRGAAAGKRSPTETDGPFAKLSDFHPAR